MLKNLVSKLALVVSLVSAPAALADDHAHEKGPHGGDVHGFGKFHLEGVRAGDKASFYVLGDDGKTAAKIAKEDGGSITVITPGKGQEKTDIPAGADFAETNAKVPASGKITVLVTLKDGAKSYSAKFNFAN